jgi:hypothetical protein
VTKKIGKAEMKHISRIFQSAVFTVLALSSALQAETTKPTTEVGMYGFLNAINGTSQLGNVTSDLDISFKDLLENLDIGFMGFVQHRRGKWSFIGDIFYADISTGGNLAFSPTLTLSVDATIKQTWVAGFVGYEVYEKKNGDTKLTLDVIGGVRYNNLDIKLDATAAGLGLVTAASRQRDENWVDGVIGMRGSYDFGNGWAANGWLDAGLGKDSNSYQIMATASYTFANNIKVYGGYRAYHMKYNTDAGPRFFEIDATYSGPILGASYKF